MKVKIHPGKIKENVVVRIPPSKSQAHRALICAALSNGKSEIRNIDFSEDVLATLEGIKALGARVEITAEKTIEVFGVSSFKKLNSEVVDCKESGSTLRFLIPLFAQSEKKIKFVGSKKLLQRPQTVYQKLFEQQQLHFELKEEGLTIQGPLNFKEIRVQGNVSSQFISGLLFLLPLFKEDSFLQVEKPYESKPYVDMTIEMMREFGIQIQEDGSHGYRVFGNQRYQARTIELEGDYSQFAFFAVLGSFVGPLECTGLKKQSLQGDKKIIEYLKTMNAQIEETAEGYRIMPSTLHGARLHIENCPDLGPILSVCASLIEDKTTLVGVERLRLKESDRVAAMEQELLKCGIETETTKDTFEITGKKSWNSQRLLHGHNDHRVVMALVIGGIASHQEITIDDAQAVNKSYPFFWEEIERIGISITKEGAQ